MKNKFLIFLTIFSVLIVSLAACNASATEPAAQDTPSQEQAPTETGAPPAQDSATAKLLQQLNGAVLTYHKSGGIAGVDEQWAVYPDGRVTRNDGKEWQVTPEEVEQLLSEIDTAGFFAVESGYIPKPIPDQFTYVITAQHGDKVIQVTAADGDESAPAAIKQSLEKLSAFFSKLQ